MKSNLHIEKLQRDLGFTGRDVDGIRGSKTNARLLAAADAGHLTASLPPLVIIKPGNPALSSGSVTGLTGVHQDLKDIVHIARARSEVPFEVIEGLRSAERQKKLVAAGASKTNASRHLTGHAVDLWPIDPATAKRLPSDAAYPRGSAEAKAADARLWSDLRKIAAVMKAVAEERGVQIEWGGDWGWDAPHFQLSRKAYPA